MGCVIWVTLEPHKLAFEVQDVAITYEDLLGVLVFLKEDYQVGDVIERSHFNSF